MDGQVNESEEQIMIDYKYNIGEILYDQMTGAKIIIVNRCIVDNMPRYDFYDYDLGGIKRYFKGTIEEEYSCEKPIILKSCPFCGSATPIVKVEEQNTAYKEKYIVTCNYKEDGCGACSGRYKEIKEAMQAWNNRV